jgi:recombination protein RecA
VGNRTRAKVVKNKIAPPFRQAEFDIVFGKGIDRLGDLVDLATNCGVIDKSGAWLSFTPRDADGKAKEPVRGDPVRLGQGREKTIDFLRDQPDLVAGIEREVFAATGTPPNPVASTKPTPSARK